MSSNSSTTKRRVKKVSNYVIGRPLGEGTFGKVRLGTHILTNQPVALKIMEKERISSLADITRVTREIQILKLLDHPNVVRLLEVIDTPRHIYLAMEFVEGGELYDFIVKNTRVDDRQACSIFHQLVNGLDYCHARHVVHRDLKPENLLLMKDGTLKLADFGLSNTIKNRQEYLKTSCGSPSYAAPEMIAGREYNGPAVDIWSSGVILYALLAGYLPFEDPSHVGLYNKILNGQFQMPSFFSDDARDLIKRMLTVNPRRRITLDGIRSHPWYTSNHEGEDPKPAAETLKVPKDIDFRIVKALEQLGFQPPYVVKSLIAGKHNQATATYFLMCERADVSSKIPSLAEQRAAASAVGLTIDDQGAVTDGDGNKVGSTLVREESVARLAEGKAAPSAEDIPMPDF